MPVGQVGHIKLDSEVWCKWLQSKQLRDRVGICVMTGNRYCSLLYNVGISTRSSYQFIFNVAIYLAL